VKKWIFFVLCQELKYNTRHVVKNLHLLLKVRQNKKHIRNFNTF